jgi:hypothetical protein
VERPDRLDTLLFLVLLLAGFWVRLGLIGGLELYSDATDPIRDAYDLLRGEYPWAGRNAVFGVGRTWSYAPLVVLGDSLERVWSLRAYLGALPGPLLLVALRRSDVPRAIQAGMASVLVGAAPVLDTMLTGHGSYLAVEWAAVAVLATRFEGRRAAAVAGLAAAMATHNHPVAAALLVGLLVLLPRWEVAAAWAVGMAPHAWFLASKWGESGGIADRVSTVAGERGALLGALGEFTGVEGYAVLGFPLVFGAAQGKREPKAALAALAAALGIVLAMGYGRPWMLRPLWPLLLLGAGVGWSDGIWARRLLPLVGVCVAVLGVTQSAKRLDPEDPWRLATVAAVGPQVGDAAQIVAYGPEVDPPLELVPLHLDRLLAGVELAGDRAALEAGDVAVWDVIAGTVRRMPFDEARGSLPCDGLVGGPDSLWLVNPEWPGGPPPAWPDCAQDR